MNSRKKTNRREFLKGKSAVNALTNLPIDAGSSTVRPGSDRPDEFGRGPSLQSIPGSQQADYLMQVERRAMACLFQVFLNPGRHDGAIEAAMDALKTVAALEDQLSVYRPDSEISQLNRNAGQQPFQAETRLFELLKRCVSLHQLTGGAFDITAGPLVSLWGFRDRKGRVPAPQQIEETMRLVGSQHLVLDDERHTVQFRIPGINVNLGSIGKGYALDRCKEVLESANVEDYLIHGGQSSILARGNRGGRSEQAGWTVSLPNPLRPEQRLAEIRLLNQAVGTSGSGRQFFYHQGRRYGHVLDPRSGRPAEGSLSATVLATSGADADALATAFFVMGPDATERYCDQLPDISVLFVSPGQRRDSVAIRTINMQDQMRIIDPAT